MHYGSSYPSTGTLARFGTEYMSHVYEMPNPRSHSQGNEVGILSGGTYPIDFRIGGTTKTITGPINHISPGICCIEEARCIDVPRKPRPRAQMMTGCSCAWRCYPFDQLRFSRHTSARMREEEKKRRPSLDLPKERQAGCLNKFFSP